jgi:hypothetical protein
VLWLYLARSNTTTSDVAELEHNSRKLDLAAWRGPLVNLYLGKTTPGQARCIGKGPMPPCKLTGPAMRRFLSATL